MHTPLTFIESKAKQDLDTLGRQFVEETDIGDLALESKQTKIRRIQLEFQRLFDDLEQALQRGWILLLEDLQQTDTASFDTLISTLDFNPQKWAELERLFQIDSLEEISNQAILGLSTEQVEGLYAAACRLYDQKKFREAGDAFQVLILLNALDYRFWLGSGFSLQAQEDVESAASLLTVAITLHPHLPLAYFALAECLTAMGRYEEALVYYEVAKEDQQEPEVII